MGNSQPFQTNSPVFNQVLALLRSSLWGEKRFPYHAPAAADWDAVYKELQHQAVPHLAVDLLVRENPALSQQYIASAAKNMLRWYKIMQEQQNICRLLEDSGIPCAVVKGASAACNYPQPSSRVMGDIDLLVNPVDFDRACLLVSEGAAYLGENYRHKEYKRNNVVVEVHRAFGIFRDPEKNELFDRRIFGAISAAQRVTTENYSFPSLPTAENGLVLLTHIDVHLENGLGLRQIIDWMMFADNILSDEYWNTEFASFVRQLNRETLAVTVTRMCQMYLGLRSDITWCAGADEDLCHQLMEYILCQGNFGRKTQNGSNCAASVIHASRNPLSFLRILQRRGCQNWNLLKRYPILKPFAWLYQLVRYIHRGVSSDHPIRFLLQAVRHSKSQTDFFEALGVSRMAEDGS